MINDIASIPFKILDWLYNFAPIGAYFDMWEELTGLVASYRMTLTHLLEGIYFVFGKQLVITVWDFWIVICICALVFALINLIGQFVP